MVRYSREPDNTTKTCKARGSDLRVKFKNTHETARAIKGMSLTEAKQYLENVSEKKDIIPFRRYRYGVGRKAQCKKYKVCNGRWPIKSCKFMLDLLKNAEGNAEVKGLDTENMFIDHIQVNKAIQGRRRTYRAHGRINAFMSHPCHVEMWLTEKKGDVAAEPESAPGPKRRSRRLQSGESS
eukprot:Plantae.Rhodophyta-Purpureofilum_apyrenoidigerum.ctg12059.p1 GENE.Plantae.Rhodophyta-Purpureofilum_apyrenoidigerum.ctg12059~~Plantae.Rhodophyta-Purpureofilum_apyrenoidigerum.ctg12059.p1  ORF type:complete len:181 (-),score=40.31 Plantae.Rhodophyta-Purpureofilum_apyrenoidigerum.ctg12059:130-672(-)